MIAVTFALPNESSNFTRLLRERDCPYRSQVRVLHTGVGQAMTQRRLPEFLERERPRFLISSGFAGAVSEQLRVGDLFLAENFADSSLAHRLENVHRGILATAPNVIDAVEERATFARERGAMAVDMETEFIAQICAGRSVPMISLRAISDTPAEPFPLPPAILFDIERQKTNGLPLASYLIKHPRAALGLIAFARRIARARHSLTEALDLNLRETLSPALLRTRSNASALE